MCRHGLFGLMLFLVGCNGLLSIDEPTIVDDGNGEASSSGPGETDDPPGGMPAAVCGDGKVEGAEECDDGNERDGDGCSACEVDCGPAPAFRDPTTHHCYLLHDLPSAAAWSEAEATCVHWGGHLASVTSADELGFITQRLAEDAWVGASEGAAGEFEWVNGEPWNEDSLWADDEPSQVGTCVAILTKHLALSAQDCDDMAGYVCEREPTP